jgi:hypothetical protein
MDTEEKGQKLTGRLGFRRGTALEVDGEGVPSGLEIFRGVDEVGMSPAKSGAWSATLGAPWFDSKRRTESSRRSELRTALLVSVCGESLRRKGPADDVSRCARVRGESGDQRMGAGYSTVLESGKGVVAVADLRREIEGEWRCPGSGDERGMEEENQGKIGGIVTGHLGL